MFLLLGKAAVAELEVGGIYETAAEFHARRLNAALRIQRIYRGHLGRRNAAERRRAKEATEVEIQRKRDEEERRKEALHDREQRRRTHPSSDADFRLLRDELEQWALDVPLHVTTRLPRGPNLLGETPVATSRSPRSGVHKPKATRAMRSTHSNDATARTHAPRRS